MNRKDYRGIAEALGKAIKDIDDSYLGPMPPSVYTLGRDLRTYARAVADFCESDNPKFKRYLFMEAVVEAADPVLSRIQVETYTPDHDTLRSGG